eukprot:gene11989-12133_t
MERVVGFKCESGNAVERDRASPPVKRANGLLSQILKDGRPVAGIAFPYYEDWSSDDDEQDTLQELSEELDLASQSASESSPCSQPIPIPSHLSNSRYFVAHEWCDALIPGYVVTVLPRLQVAPARNNGMPTAH